MREKHLSRLKNLSTTLQETAHNAGDQVPRSVLPVEVHNLVALGSLPPLPMYPPIPQGQVSLSGQSVVCEPLF